MTYEMRIERMLDAPAELVFDTMLDPAYKDEIYTDLVDGWSARRVEVDLRIGGTWRTEFGPRDSDGPIDFLTNVFTAIDRPRRWRTTRRCTCRPGDGPSTGWRRSRSKSTTGRPS